MKITRRTDYAIHLIADLATDPQACFGLRALAEKHGVTYAFARTVQQGLLKAKLVKATRGINGGIMLAKPLDKITLLEVFEAAQNPLNFAFSNKGYSWCGCEKKTCITNKVWEASKQSLHDTLKATTMADLIKK